MTLPLPLESEDELAIGHIGRLRRWCGASTRDELVRAMRERVGSRGTQAMPGLHAVAKACGLRVNLYVARHSMLPFTCFLVNESHELQRFVPGWSDRVVNAIGYVTPLKLPIFCGRCAVEQRDRLTYSTWRRALQLPGQLRCPKHGCALLHAPDAESFMHQPSDLLASNRYAQVPERTWADDHPAVVRYVACAKAMLDTCRSWPTDRVQACLSRRAEALGLRTRLTESSTLLSDLALDTFPTAFLEEQLQLSTGSSSGGVVQAIDNCIVQTFFNPTSPATAIAMSLLYSSPDEAISEFTQFEHQQAQSGSI